MKTKELVYLDDLGNAVTSTLLLADALDINHADVFNEVRRELEEEKNELEAEGETAEDGELWMFYLKRTFIDSQGKTHDIYEITRDGMEILTWSYKDKEALIKEVLIKEFNKLNPPIFQRNLNALTKDEEEAVLGMLNFNSEEAITFKKATVRELNRRAGIISSLHSEIFELRKKLEFFNAKTILDYAN